MTTTAIRLLYTATFLAGLVLGYLSGDWVGVATAALGFVLVTLIFIGLDQ